MKELLRLILGIYKATISGFLKLVFVGGCRFTPTCSEYAKDALLKYGLIKGLALSIRRVSKCHAFNHESTFDPVA